MGVSLPRLSSVIKLWLLRLCYDPISSLQNLRATFLAVRRFGVSEFPEWNQAVALHAGYLAVTVL
jgi:hypothetical protein